MTASVHYRRSKSLSNFINSKRSLHSGSGSKTLQRSNLSSWASWSRPAWPGSSATTATTSSRCRPTCSGSKLEDPRASSAARMFRLWPSTFGLVRFGCTLWGRLLNYYRLKEKICFRCICVKIFVFNFENDGIFAVIQRCKWISDLVLMGLGRRFRSGSGHCHILFPVEVAGFEPGISMLF